MDNSNLKKKILYVITKGNWGGAQRYVFDLATNLDKNEFNIAVAFGEGEALKNKLTKSHIRCIQIKSLGRDIKIGNDLKVFIELVKLFRKEKPDIIHLNSSKIGAMGALAGRIARIPKIIFTAHGWAFKENRNFLTKSVIKLLSWITVLLAHTTIVVSKDDFKKSEKFPFCENKTHTIYNGIGNTSFKEGFQARQIVGNGIRENVWIGTIAELNHNKGIDLLMRSYVDIASEYPDTALVIIGDGVDKEKLITLSQILGIEKRVYFLGFMERASYYLKAFDIFVLTSRKEGVPYVILEAGKAALPVISTPIGGIPETIEPYKTGLLSKSTEPYDISKSLHFALQNPEKMKLYGQNLRELIQKSFTLSKMIEETCKIYTHENNHTSK